MVDGVTKMRQDLGVLIYKALASLIRNLDWFSFETMEQALQYQEISR